MVVRVRKVILTDSSATQKIPHHSHWLRLLLVGILLGKEALP